ncbi:hypothetical protein GCM10027570_16420 [Streptomonospora sediminis]
MDNRFPASAAPGEPTLELEMQQLEMQELETMEAPGFWTSALVGAGVSASFAISLT